MKDSKLRQSLFYWLFVVTGFYILLPFILLVTYNQPAADDYFGAVRDSTQSFNAVFWDTYLHWSGRYFAIIISRINPLIFNSLNLYRAYSLVIILSFVAALFVLARVLTAAYLTKLQTAALSCLFVFLYFTVLPGTAEGFYWFSAACIYQTSNILFMLMLACIVKWHRASTKYARGIYFFITVLLAVSIIGCNEVSLIITCFVVGAIPINLYVTRRKHDKLLWLLTIICIVAACISVLAPGNYLRLGYLQDSSRSPFWVVEGAAAITAIYVSQWALPLLIVTLLYVIFWGNTIAVKVVKQGLHSYIKPVYSIVFFTALFLLLQLFIVWVAGGSNLGRIENVIYLFFLIGWFFNVQLLVNAYHSKQKPISSLSKPMMVLIVLLFFMDLFDINNNITTAYIDLVSGKARRYNIQLNERMDVVKQCRQDTCIVKALSDVPKTLFFTDIKSKQESEAFWMNEAYARFVGVKFVLVDAPLPPIKTNLETIREFGKQARQPLVH